MERVFNRHKQDIANICDALESGEAPGAELWANLVDMEKFIKDTKKQIQSLVEDEVLKMNKGEQYYGCEFSIVERKNWAYDNSVIIDNAEQRVKTLKDIAKQAAKLKQAIATDDGELIEPAYIKSVTTSIKVKQV